MANRIKLDNIRRTYDRKNGSIIQTLTTEYVCPVCRRLVEQNDSYCWNCGNELGIDIDHTEHYYKGNNITDDYYNKIKANTSIDLDNGKLVDKEVNKEVDLVDEEVNKEADKEANKEAGI